MIDPYISEYNQFKEQNKYDKKGIKKLQQSSNKGGNIAFILVILLISLGMLNPIFSSIGTPLFRIMLIPISIGTGIFIRSIKKSTSDKSKA